MKMLTTDTLIIGAGPAGTACAITLQQGGHDCLLVEKRTYPRHKLCGGLFTFKAQKVLQSLLGETAFRECMDQVTCSQEQKLGLWRRTESIVTFEPRRPITLIDRPALDCYLFRHYQSLGGQTLEGDALQSVDFQNRIATLQSGQQVSYRRIIAADGANSSVERLLAAADKRFRRKKAKVATLEINVDKADLAVEGVNIYFDIVPKTYAWAFNKGDKTCLGIGKMPDQDIDINQRFRDFLQMLGLRHAENYPLKGAMIPYGQVEPEWNDRSIFFVGDAAGLVEPLTWEGIYFALRSGQMAAESVLAGKSYAKMVAGMRRKIRHGQFCQRLFEYPSFLRKFYGHAGKHARFMSEFYSDNIDDVPHESLFKKASVLAYKIAKHTMFG